MSNLIVRVREVSQLLANARAAYTNAPTGTSVADLEEMEEEIYDLEDELLDLEEALEDETAQKHSNTRVSEY